MYVNVKIPGIQGILNAYQSCLPTIELYGPTNISPVINHIASYASQTATSPTADVRHHSRYFCKMSIDYGYHNYYYDVHDWMIYMQHDGIKIHGQYVMFLSELPHSLNSH